MPLHLKTKLYFFKKSVAYLKNYKRLSVLIILLSIISSIFDGFSIGALIPFLQNLTSDTAASTQLLPLSTDLQKQILGNTREDMLIRLLLFALVMIILRSIFNYWRTISIEKARYLIRGDLQNNIFRAISGSSLRFYYNLKTGNLVGSITSYTNSIVAFIFSLLNLVSNLSRIAIYLILLFWISWHFTLVAITVELLFFPLIRYLLNRIKSTGQSITDQVGHLYSYMVEMIANIPLIKIFGTEDQEQSHFSSITRNLALLEYKQSKQTTLIPFLTENIVMLSILLLFTISIKILNLDVITHLPFIIAYLYVFLRLFSETNVFLRSISGMFEHAPAFRAYENDLNRAKNLTLDSGRQPFFALNKYILLKNISFGYHKNHPILKNITLSINKGEFVAIIGPTGSGKTTIANLIAGLFFPDQGNLLIDDTSIENLDLKLWRAKIGYISQDPIILNDTIYNNIA